MGTIDALTDRLNEYLKKHGLGVLPGRPANVEILYESALSAVWKKEDKESRDALASEITIFLKKYVGGKNMEELYARIAKKLDGQLDQHKQATEKQTRQDRLKDPNYVPSFDELFSDDKKSS